MKGNDTGGTYSPTFTELVGEEEVFFESYFNRWHYFGTRL